MKNKFKGRLILSKNDSIDGWYSRGYFPHFSAENQTQHVCMRLFDSIPQQILQQWEAELNILTKREYDLERRKRIESFLDSGYGNCFLKQDPIAEIVQNALLYFDWERYVLHAWCVMPNHVHTLITPESGIELTTIIHSWKSFTANQCNKLLSRSGSFWQKEPYDRYIRNEEHFRNAVIYIENNPVNAGLCKSPEEWKWSSASRRLGTHAS